MATIEPVGRGAVASLQSILLSHWPTDGRQSCTLLLR